MNARALGLMAGMALAFAGYFGGFVAFLLVGALGGLGYAVGAWLERDGAAQLREAFERSRR